jgi:hypothetical protein
MSDAIELKAIAEQAAKEAVRSTLLTLGIDVDDPIAAQEDFAVLREVGKLVRDPEFRKDLEAVRLWRNAQKELTVHGLKAAVGLIVVGALGALWLGIQAYLGK